MPTAQRDNREAVLEQRVRDLEAELYRREDRGYGGRGGRGTRRVRRDFDETREDVQDLGDRKIDEVARLFTGAIRASLEGLRVAAESTSYFVEDTLERNIPDRGEDSVDVARRLPADLSRGFVRSLDRGLDLPGRAAERFERTFTREEGGERRRRIGRGDRWGSTRSRRRRASLSEDYERWTTDELYDRAAEVGIDDFMDMTRDEIIDALRSEQPRYEDWSNADLYLRAGEAGVAGRAEMSREQLIEELRRRDRRTRPARPPLEREDRYGGGGAEGESDLDRLSKAELEERAADLGIEDPEGKARDELVVAIRHHEVELDDLSTPELRARARSLGIEEREKKDRKQLVTAIRNRERQSESSGS
ncbi:MAG TPA: hypothetical protein VF549_15580 [Solirubrobacteraceae bacterium]|jgi:hypothetical protein